MQSDPLWTCKDLRPFPRTFYYRSKNPKLKCFSFTLDSGLWWNTLNFFLPLNRNALECFLPSCPHPDTADITKQGPGHPRPPEGRPAAGSLPTTRGPASNGGFPRVGQPRAARAAKSHFLWLSPRVSIAKLPGSNQARRSDHLPSSPRGRSPAGGPGSSTATPTLP